MAQKGTRGSGFSMPPAIYMAYNLSVVWIFCTFGIVPQSASVAPSGVAGSIPVWMLYSLVQIVALIAFIVLGRRADRVATNGAFALLASVMMVAGALVMRQGSGPLAVTGSIVAGLGGVFLMLPWSAVSSRLDVRGFEQMMLGSTGVAFAMMLVMAFIPEPIRYIYAQVLPIVSAVLVLLALRHPLPSCDLTSDEREWTPMREIHHLDLRTVLSAVIAIVVPAALTFLLFFFVTGEISLKGGENTSFLAVGGFLLAFIVVLLFLRFTPSVGLAFMYRWQAAFIVVAVGLIVFFAQAETGYLIINALMVVTSQFTWAFFGKVNRSTDVGYVRTFMGGLLLVQTGIASGSCIAFLIDAAEIPSQAGLTAAIIVLMVMVVGFILMPDEVRPTESPLPEAPQESDEALALEMARRYALSARETEVFLMLVKGRSAPYIRDQLYISQNTVNTHIKHIYAKTDTHTRQEVIDLFEGEKNG